jgi:hypothetical protein
MSWEARSQRPDTIQGSQLVRQGSDGAGPCRSVGGKLPRLAAPKNYFWQFGCSKEKGRHNYAP